MEEGKKRKSIAEREEETLAFWRAHNIFEKSLEQTRGGEPFVFYDGPPFATGLPHYGHLLASIIKDAIPRYWTMRGKFVARRWGWDCHGLPLENVVEQKLGLKSKKEIVEYGIDKFNEVAKTEVLRYADDWKKIIPRVGRWVDMENDYKTMDPAYTETVWWIFKRLYNKGLIYEGYKSMHLCPRCETTLANFEVSLGYKDITDVSVTVKFKLEPGQKIGGFVTDDNTYILAWTTTPWTLPGNVALAVGENIEYVAIHPSLLGQPKQQETLIFARDRLLGVQSLLQGFVNENEISSGQSAGFDFDSQKVFKGSSLVGKKYKPVFDYFVNNPNIKNKENGWQIYAADFVKTEEGTGVVHIAPAFGDDDMQLGKKFNLPFVQHVTRDGKFMPEVTDFAGRAVKPKDTALQRKIDEEILLYLKEHNAYFSEMPLTHSYPHCWRCDTPLLNYAASSWFVNVPQIREKLIENNKTISWVPEHIKEGRFGKGLETAPDWAISRSRFWGAPLPVWRCEDCKAIEVAGSLEDLNAKRADTPATLILMRHGERDDIPVEIANNPTRHGEIMLNSLLEEDAVHITQEGKEHVRQVAEQLQKEGGVDAIYASDFIRAKETAEILSATLGTPVTYDTRLRELQHGTDFQGKTVAEYYAFFANPLERFTKQPTGGESLNNVRARMMSIAREITEKYAGKRVLVVGHGDPLWILEGALQFREPKDMIATRNNDYIQEAQTREIVFPNYPFNAMGEVDFHRPYSDAIYVKCSCGSKMARIPEVFDCWFESGSMPYGQHHYIGEPVVGFNPELRKGPALRSSQSEGGFPADFIAEGLDQTRGWFYSLHVLAGGLFEKPAFTHVLVNGLILAENGQKMSKRLKNYPDPMDVVARYGADALRLYLLGSPAVVAEDLNFSEKGVDEVSKKIIQRLSHVYSFYEMYAHNKATLFSLDQAAHVLDKYVLYELCTLASAVSRATEEYRLDRAVRAIAEFTDMFSTVYLQYSRDRFKEDDDNAQKALSVFRYVLCEMAKIVAPFAPFIAEELYQNVRTDTGKESVHLEPWSTPDEHIKEWVTVHEEMEHVKNAIEWILAERAAQGIAVRQPLARAWVAHLPHSEEYRDIIRRRTNIEEVTEKELPEDVHAEIDTTLTSDLKAKGVVREFVRGVQDLRKKQGLLPGERIALVVSADENIRQIIEAFLEEIKKSVGAANITFSATESVHVVQLQESAVHIDMRKVE